MSHPFGLPADSIAAVNGERFLSCEVQSNVELSADSAQLLRGILPPCLPVAIPNQAGVLVHASHARTRATDALLVIKLAPANVAQSKMRQVEVVDVPGRKIRIA